MDDADRVKTERDALVGYIPSDQDRQEFDALIDVVPEAYQGDYFRRLRGVLGNKSEVASQGGVRGILSELRRINSVMEAGKETVDFELAGKIGEVTYQGYSKHANPFEAPDKMIEKSPIDSDVPIARGGEPYIYEVKSYMKWPYGSEIANYNQALKYQNAIDQHVAAGASIQIQGRLDADFMRWAQGDSQVQAHIPDVEMLYSLQLPSGRLHTIVLKEGIPGEGLQYVNEPVSDRVDQEVAESLERARADGSIVDILTAEDYVQVPPELAPYIANPRTIPTPELFALYKQVWQTALYDRLLARTGVGEGTSNGRRAA
jgi:hypothetical protein